MEGVAAAVRSGEMDLAKRLAKDALERGLEHPVLLNLRALDFEDAGRFKESLADLRRAHFLSPKDFTILNACGLCLSRMDQTEEALRCYDQALALKPTFGQAWFNRGWVLERLGETAEAAESYAKAADINPENAQAWANMASLANRRGDAAAARRNADRALALEPGHPTAVLVLAELGLSEPRVAERQLRDLLTAPLSPFERALALGQLGDALDALDKPAQAFAAYSASNAIFREESIARFEAPGQPTYADAWAWMIPWAANLEARQWARDEGAAGEAGEKAHVFLLGFPRSGTTLIESVLTAHPDVVSLEERETLRTAVLTFLSDPTDVVRLPSVQGRELRALREDYWTRVRGFGVEPAGKIFIDKNPFNTIKLPLINKLFPNAKIIFAVRDPRDVVLSCFRRRFNLNAATYEFFDLDRTAVNYSGAMRLAEILRGKLAFDEYQLVYEKLIADFPAVAREVCEFIGADWRPELADFAGRARRGAVASASSAQIARGLYLDATAQWRPYRAQLAPVLPTLAPWIERFGYPAD